MKQRRTKRWLIPVLLVLPVFLTACGGDSASDVTEPAVLEQVAGTDLYRITLTPETAKRLDIQTVAVEEGDAGTVVPYSAVFYSPNGQTWAYVNPESLTFVRRAIVVDHIDGDRAVLSAGPSMGTKVATVGVPELHGIESGTG